MFVMSVHYHRYGINQNVSRDFAGYILIHYSTVNMILTPILFRIFWTESVLGKYFKIIYRIWQEWPTCNISYVELCLCHMICCCGNKYMIVVQCMNLICCLDCEVMSSGTNVKYWVQNVNLLLFSLLNPFLQIL